MDRDALPGIVFWCIFLAAAAFGVTHHLWYDPWSLGERINFWVAAGTGALAIVTAASVLATMSVVGSEDRRHREGLAPICVAIFERADIYVQNVGLGPAIDVVVLGSVSYDAPIFEEPDSKTWTSPLPREVGRNKGRSSFEAERISVVSAVSAVPGARDEKQRVIGGAWATPFPSHGELRNKLLYSDQITDVRVLYADMFGNKYETRYTDLQSDRYEWLRPARYI